MQTPFFRPTLVSALALACQVVMAQSAAQSAAELPTVTITGNYNNAVGTSDAASQGVVTSKLIESRPTLRPAEVLEFVPGVIVSQHSGDGKANQYYLRGFNLDHGTDFATTVDGMPVNMPTHAHGQGYSDLNWLIPELVDRINYRKGPYYADEGDFASAGAAHIKLFDQLPRGLASVTVGENGYERALLTSSTALSAGKLLYALEAAHNDGPWDQPENFRRLNGVLRYSFGDGDTRSSLTGMAYTAQWRATDQVPQRALSSGLISRFGTIDASDHGETSRYSLSYKLLRAFDDGEFKLNAYAVRSSVDLYSNFTYFLDDPVHGDQFEQAEHRNIFGLNSSRRWETKIAGLDSANTLGIQVRQDRMSPVGLYAAEGGQRLSTTQESRVRETSVGLYAENQTQWQPWLKTIAGLRADQFRFNVDSSIAANSGQKSSFIGSPKLSLVFGPWDKTEYFVNYGHGFHSNDARGVTSSISPKEGLPIETSPALVRTKGAEIGLRSEIIPGLQSSVALWQLQLGSELVFSGDAGDTQASGASKRHGIEFNNHYVAKPWLLFDADIALSQSRFDKAQGDEAHMGRHIPGSVRTVASFGATVMGWGPWSGQLQVRYFGPRPLIEDNSQRSQGTTLAYARVGYKVSPDVKVALDVFNLFNRQVSDIDYYYASRLPQEAAEGVGDIHSHPAEPRTFRVTLNVGF